MSEYIETGSLEQAVFTAVGAGSACWENLKGAGEFDSTRAKAVADELVAWIEANYERREDGSASDLRELRLGSMVRAAVTRKTGTRWAPGRQTQQGAASAWTVKKLIRHRRLQQLRDDFEQLIGTRRVIDLQGTTINGQITVHETTKPVTVRNAHIIWNGIPTEQTTAIELALRDNHFEFDGTGLPR